VEIEYIRKRNYGRSRILVVDVAVKESHDDVQHGRTETDFVARLAAKHAESFGFRGALVRLSGFRLLLLEQFLMLDALLPLAILLVPVVRWLLGERRA
jgi:hypothetical protein